MIAEFDEYLRDAPLTESLLLQLVLYQRERKLILVYDYAAETVARSFAGGQHDNTRDFRMLRFHGVEDVEVVDSRGHTESDALKLLQDRIADSSVVVLSAITDGHNGLEIELSQSFSISLRFENVEWSQRKAVARQVGENHWKYEDIETLEELDFLNPFDL